MFTFFRGRLEEVVKKIKREADVSSSDQRMARRNLLGPVGKLNTVTPCAACKLLRRRCAQECPFSPYFSPHEPHKFASVHKVFGASNVSKMLMVYISNFNFLYHLQMVIFPINFLNQYFFPLFSSFKIHKINDITMILMTNNTTMILFLLSFFFFFLFYTMHDFFYYVQSYKIQIVDLFNLNQFHVTFKLQQNSLFSLIKLLIVMIFY